MNLGSPIELLLLAIFVGGGAVVGEMIGGSVGTVIGGVMGFLLRYGFGRLVDRLPLPGCSCGADWPEGFDISDPLRGQPRYACRKCGKTYEFQGRFWSERLPSGTVFPRMRRNFLGFWKVL